MKEKSLILLEKEHENLRNELDFQIAQADEIQAQFEKLAKQKEQNPDRSLKTQHSLQQDLMQSIVKTKRKNFSCQVGLSQQETLNLTIEIKKKRMNIKELKEVIEDKDKKIWFYKDKSQKLDETMVVNDIRIKKLERIHKN